MSSLDEPVVDPSRPLSEDEEFGIADTRVRRQRPELGEDWEAERSLDTSDVHVGELEGWSGDPDWVISADYREEDLGAIKSGKEAEVRLVRRTSGPRSCLVAVKRYRPRAERSFRREEDYREGAGLGDDRVNRAVGKRTRFGRSVLEYAWAYREYPLMRRAWDSGVRVPYPIESVTDGVVMQYLGDEDGPAPRLADITLERREAEEAFLSVVEDIRKLLDVYLVHADLSPYNILWFRSRPWLIDFPQAVDVAHHSRGVDFLRRDVENVCAYFARCGVPCDPMDLFGDVLRTSPFAWTDSS